MECALVENRGRSERWDYNLDEAFVWSDTEEDREFWLACYEGNWDKAKELQPSLFKPIDGKPHIKLRQRRLPHGPFWSLDVITEECGICESQTDAAWRYILDVNPNWYTTIQEAVDALYSFKRGDANEDT
jgi:hypothetical protein